MLIFLPTALSIIIMPSSSATNTVPLTPSSTAPRRCRHCAGFSLDDRITYSSVLVAGSVLRRTIESIEERIIPCVTAVCPTCDRVSLISDGSTESMLCSIFMWQRLREWIDTAYEGGGAAAVAEVKIDSIKAEEEDSSSSSSETDSSDDEEEQHNLPPAAVVGRS